jgi:parvulin-like peptidyl-prolyl isomerase
VAPWRRGVPEPSPEPAERPSPDEGVRSAYADARNAAATEDVRPASFSADAGKRELKPAEVKPESRPAAGPEPVKRPVAPPNEMDAITDTTILALVNSEAILASEVLPLVEAKMAQILAQIPPEQMEAAAPEVARVKKMLLQNYLEPLIQRKLLYQDARRDIPKPNFRGVEDQLVKDFDGRIDQMVAKKGYANRRQLDEEMTKQGNSLAMQRKSFIEEMLAREWLKRNSEISEDVRREELLSWYRAHQSDYEMKARVRWEQLMVRFDKFDSKEQARFAIGKLGNRVLDREDFAAVAKSASHGPTAPEGGKRPWTTQGALVSKVLDEALFKLPVGQLSPILEDEQGLHIVRVIERQDAGKKPFEDVQGDIREKIKAERREKAQEKYAAKLHASAHIWRLLGEPEARPEKPEKKPKT